jgi:hypothetical protein
MVIKFRNAGKDFINLDVHYESTALYRLSVCLFHIIILLSLSVEIQGSVGHEINIEDRGAVGDGVFKNTEIIQSVIDDLNQN